MTVPHALLATPDMHFRWPPGPHLWEVCRRCDLGKHSCPGCGTDLRHDGIHELDGSVHPDCCA